MAIPVGPLGQHAILKIVKQQKPDGSIRLIDESIKGTHDGTRRQMMDGRHSARPSSS